MRYIFLVVVSFYTMFGALVDAVSITVNDEPITLYDVDEYMLKTSLTKQEAQARLIDQKLYDQEIKKRGISVDYFDVSNYIEKLAKQNGMDIVTFKSVIKQQYQDYDKFTQDIKKRLLHQKLVASIIRGNIKLAKDDDIKVYYDTHISDFTLAKDIQVIQYSSKNKQKLLALQKNPLMIDSKIEANELTLTQQQINQKLKYLLNQTKVGNFTPIITANKLFVMFYIKNKTNKYQIPFKDVKTQILNIVMKQREDRYLKEYFQKLKLTADINVIR